MKHKLQGYRERERDCALQKQKNNTPQKNEPQMNKRLKKKVPNMEYGSLSTVDTGSDRNISNPLLQSDTTSETTLNEITSSMSKENNNYHRIYVKLLDFSKWPPVSHIGLDRNKI